MRRFVDQNEDIIFLATRDHSTNELVIFDDYWKAVRTEHRAFRQSGLLEWEMLHRGDVVVSGDKAWSVDWLRFSSVGDALVYGWVARPADHVANGVGFLWLPGYSYGTPAPDSTNLVPGATTLCVNVHGNTPEAPYVNPAGKNDYIAQGIDRPETYIFRSIVLHCLNAVDVLAEIAGVDPTRLVAAGMSQGGALALITVANHSAPKLCFADMPFFCNVRVAISHGPMYRAVRQAMEAKPDLAAAIMETISLFDPVYHAPRIHVPTSLIAGGRDPSSRAETIPPVFDSLSTKVKQFRLFPDAGHVFLPEMAETYSDWIAKIIL